MNLFQKKSAKVTIGNQIPYFPDDDKTDESSILETEPIGELEKTLRSSHDWAVDRIHALDEDKEVENARAIQYEFNEWMDPEIPEHDVFSLEYLGDQCSKDE